MARVKKNSILSNLSGGIGKEIVFKQYRDKTVVSKYPDMEGIEPSEKQKLQRDKMRAAQAHWLRVKKDAALRAIYEKHLISGERLYNRVIKDFMKGSSISSQKRV